MPGLPQPCLHLCPPYLCLPASASASAASSAELPLPLPISAHLSVPTWRGWRSARSKCTAAAVRALGAPPEACQALQHSSVSGAATRQASYSPQGSNGAQVLVRPVVRGSCGSEPRHKYFERLLCTMHSFGQRLRSSRASGWTPYWPRKSGIAHL